MTKINARLAGVELYFDDLPAAKRFYEETLGLKLSREQTGHHAQFDTGPTFLCLEKKGMENYPSQDKAVIFLEVASVDAAIKAIGQEHIARHESGLSQNSPSWAVLHDPEGHNVLLLESRADPSRS
jgi:predicted enzyme related to lactoylglutathione lyase